MVAAYPTLADIGWKEATIDGAYYLRGLDNLPAGWSEDLSVNGEARITALKSSTRKAYQGGSVTAQTEGTVILVCRFTSATQPSSAFFVRCSTYFDMTTEANTEKTGASAQAFSDGGGFTCPRAYSSDYGPGATFTVNKGPLKRFWRNLQWTPDAGGGWTTNMLEISRPALRCTAIASNNAGQGNWTAAYAKGVSSVRVQASIDNKLLARVEGSTNAMAQMIAEPYANNVSQGLYAVDVASSIQGTDFDLDTGMYVIKFWAQGALRKALSVNVIAGQTVGGVDVALKFGDLDGDNFVSQAEVDFLSMKVGTVLNATNSINPLDPYVLSYGDFDRDGTISSADWLSAQANVGLTGD